MRVRILPSSPESPDNQFLTTFLVNDTVAIDAGCLGLYREPRDQARIAHIFLTHSHADHVCSLPMFLTNVYPGKEESVVVHGHPRVLETLRTDIFNDRIWPNFSRLSDGGMPVVKLRQLEPRLTVVVDDLRITPVLVNHTVPTFGYIVDDDAAVVVFSPDSGPTEEIWKTASERPHLKAVFMGVAFPDESRELAAAAGHLTPRSFREEVTKLPEQVWIVAIHIKPSHRTTIIDELSVLPLTNVKIGVCGREYVF